MEKNKRLIPESSETMTGMQDVIYQVEAFLCENYQFRRNVLSGKTEMAPVVSDEGQEPKWEPVTVELLNSIVRRAKKEGIGGKKSPRKDIEEYICSKDIVAYDPIRDYLEALPEWDGRNHVAGLFGRLPGITSEQLGWCSVWMRSVVAHWLGMDLLHGNEYVPVLVGPQGCGKSTFAVHFLNLASKSPNIQATLSMATSGAASSLTPRQIPALSRRGELSQPHMWRALRRNAAAGWKFCQ